MNVIDFSATKTREPVKHHAALPNSIRMIIIGPSGSGKTQLLLNLIMRWMKWNKLYLVAPSVDDQRCYEVLKDFNENASQIPGENVIEFITDIDEAPSIDDIDCGVNNLVVYDDVMLDNQKNPARIFSRGWHHRLNSRAVHIGLGFYQLGPLLRKDADLLRLAVQCNDLGRERRCYRFEKSLNTLWGQYMQHEIKTSKFLSSVGELYGLRVFKFQYWLRKTEDNFVAGHSEEFVFMISFEDCFNKWNYLNLRRIVALLCSAEESIIDFTCQKEMFYCKGRSASPLDIPTYADIFTCVMEELQGSQYFSDLKNRRLYTKRNNEMWKKFKFRHWCCRHSTYIVYQQDALYKKQQNFCADQVDSEAIGSVFCGQLFIPIWIEDVHGGKEWTSYNKSFWPSDGKSQVDSEKCYLNWSQDHLYFSNGITVLAISFGTEAVRPRSYIVQNDDRYHYVCVRLASFSQYQGSGFGTRLAQSGFVYDVSRNMVVYPWDGSDVSSEITRNQHIKSCAFVRQFYQINIPLHEAPSPPLPAAFGFDMAATMTFSPATEEQPDRIQSQTETDSTEVASREEPNQNAGYGLGQPSEGLNAAVIGPVGLKDQEETSYNVHHAENNNADAISVMTLYIWDLLEGKRGSRVSCQHSEGSRDENMDIETLSGCMWLLKWQPLKLCTVQTFQYDKKEHSWMSKQILQERGLHSISVEGYGDFIDGVTEECIDKIGNDSDTRGRSLGLTLKLSDKRENENFIKFVILYTIAKELNSTEIESCRIREERVDLTATLCAEVEAENLRFKKGTVKVIAQNLYGKELADLRVNEITVVVTAQTIFSTESVVKNLIVKKETAECTFRTSGEAEVQDLVNVETLTVITKPQTSAGMKVEYLRVEKGTVDNAAQMSDCTYIEDLRVKKRSWEMTVQSSISEKAKNQIVSDETLKISAKSTDGISSKVHTEKGENVKSIAKEDGILEDYALCVYEELVKITPKATYKEMFESYKTECCLIDRDGKVEGYNNIVPSNGQDVAQYFDDCVKMDDLNKLSLQGTCKSEDVTNEDNINYLFSYQDIHKGMYQLDVLEILESIKEKRKQGYGAKEREHGLLEKRDVEIVPCFQEDGPWLESHPSVSGVHHEFTPVTSNEESLLPVVVTEEPFDAFPLKFKEISDDNSDHSSISTDRCSDFISLEFIKKKALCSELRFRTTENPLSFVSLKSNKKRMEGLIHLKEIVKLQSCRWQLESSSMKDFFETIDAGLHQVKNAVEIEQHIQSDTVTVQKEECVVEIDETSARDIDLTENKKYHLRKDVLFPRNWLPLPRLSRDAIVGFVEEQTRDGHGGSTLTPSEHEELREMLRLLASDNVPGPQITMKYEMLRLCTMKTFPGRDRPFAIRIVGAGFYYAGHQDQVICYCCGNRKDSWVIGDIPLLIHQNMAPDCGFLAHNAQVNVPIRKANSSESPSLAEVRLLAVQRFYGSNQSDTAQSESSLMLPSSEQNWRHNVSDNLPTISAHVDSVEEPPPKYPQYAVKNMRINSFQGWPAELRQRPEEMAECGFYYAGFSDCVRCFFCGVGLRHWMSEDDPWIEHARWSMSCIYVLKMKGEEFVSLIKMAVEIAEREEAARNNSGGNQASKESKEAAPTVVIQEAPKSSVTTNSTAIKDLPGSVGATDGNVVRGAESSLPPGNSEIQKYLLTDAAQSVLDMGYQPKLVQRAIERVLIKKATEELTGEIIMEAVFEIDEEDKLQSKKPVSLQSAEGDKSSEKGHEASGNTQSEGSQIDPEKIIREHRELHEATLCKICMENTISVVFLPCGHLVTCPDCAPAMRKCPICRALIKGTVKTFYG